VRGVFLIVAAPRSKLSSNFTAECPVSVISVIFERAQAPSAYPPTPVESMHRCER